VQQSRVLFLPDLPRYVVVAILLETRAIEGQRDPFSCPKISTTTPTMAEKGATQPPRGLGSVDDSPTLLVVPDANNASDSIMVLPLLGLLPGFLLGRHEPSVTSGGIPPAGSETVFQGEDRRM
jgi:hypothetical protein